MSAAGTGTITYDTDLDATGTGELQINAAGAGLLTAGGDITFRGQDLDIINGQINATAGATSDVFILTRDLADVIQFGTEVAGAPLGLTDADVDQITAGVLHIGSTATNTGGIDVTGTTSLAVGLVPVLHLTTAGAITDATGGEQDDITANSLVLEAGTGIGSADTLNVAALTNLAILNTTSGNVQLSNRLFSANGTVNITTVDGVVGAANNGPGNLFVANKGTMNVLQLVTATGGGDIGLVTSGATADINLSTDGAVVASGGVDGDINLDTSLATSGGAINVNNTTPFIEINATGAAGDIVLNARDLVAFATNVNVQSGNVAAGGNITANANVGVPGGGADITLASGVNITTRGNVVLNTDPDGALTGMAQANIVMDPTSIIKGNGNAAANNTALNITLRADGDITVSSAIALLTADLRAAGNILDDSAATTTDATFVQGTNINLSAGGRIGGFTAINPVDVFSGNTATPTAQFRAAIDYDLDGGLLTISQANNVVANGTGGNVQLRQVDDALDANPEVVLTSGFNFAQAVINAGNQLALISSAGNLQANNGFVVPSDANALLATVNGFSVQVTTGAINNPGAAASTTIIASGGAGANIDGPAAPDGTADIVGTNVNLITTGGSVGAIGSGGAIPLEINVVRLDGDTTGLNAGVPQSAAGGNVNLIDTQNGISLGRITTGTAGDFTLVSQGNILGGSSIVAVAPSDGVAEIVGDVVNLTATGTSTGTLGQIGTAGQFVEVDSFTVNATTNTSNLWLSAVGANDTTRVGTITVGAAPPATLTAFLRTANGATLSSLTVDGVADVLAPNLNLSNVLGGGGGNFGGLTTATPLEVNAGTLSGTLAGGGNEFVRSTNAAGLIVQQASTATGNVGLETTGAVGTLTLGTAASAGPAAVSTGGTTAATGTVTLRSANGSIVTGAGNPVSDVAGLVLSATAPMGGVGTTANPLETVLGTAATAGTLTATAGLGQVVVTNNSPGAALGLNNVTASGDVVIGTVNTAAAGENLTVNAGQAVTSMTTLVNLQAADDLTVLGSVTANTTATLGAGTALASSGAVTATTGAANLTAGTTLTTTAGGTVTGVGAALMAGTALSTAAAVNAGTGAANLTAGTTLTTLAGGTVAGTGATLTATAGALSAAATVNAGTGAAALTAGTSLTTLAGANVTAGTGASLQAGTSLTTAGTVTGGTTAGLIALGGPLAVGGAVTAGTSAALQGTSVTNTAAVAANGGTATVTATAGAVNVNANVNGSTGTTVTALDSAAAGQDITVAAAATVSAGAGANVSLLAGDNVTVSGTVTVTGAGIAAISGDVGSLDAAGTAINVSTATFNTATPVQLNGNTEADTFTVRPQIDADAVQTVVGNNPMTFPGDVLNVVGDTGTTLAVTGVGSGNFLFGNGAGVNFTGIESLDTATPFALTLNLMTLGFQDASPMPDVVNISTTAGGVLNVTVQNNSTGVPVSVFSGPAADVSQLNLVGSTDRETVTVDETNAGVPTSNLQGGLPAGTPGDSLIVNTTNATGTAVNPAAGTYTFTNRNTITFAGFENFTPGVVTIAATDGNASETGTNETANNGQFTITRVGDLSVGLTVNYTIGGSAVNGVDYQTIGTSVAFIPGQATAVVNIVPINNSKIDGSRSVLLTVVPATGYLVGPNTAAIVTIADNDSAPRRIATGSDSAGDVRVFDNGSTTPTFALRPYGGYTGGVAVAVGDVNGDGVADFATGATQFSSHVKVFNGVNGQELASFLAFTNFAAGVGVALADLDGDGSSEIIVGALTANPHVKVFKLGANGATTEIASFIAFQGAPNIGVSVAGGDTDGDGRASIIVGARGIANHVKTFDLVGNAAVERLSFFAVSPSQSRVGVSVGSGDLDGDGIAEILVGTIGNGGNSVNSYSAATVAADPVNARAKSTLRTPTPGAPNQISDFGPPVAAADIDGDGREELFTSSGPVVSIYDGGTFNFRGAFAPYLGFVGGVFLG